MMIGVQSDFDDVVEKDALLLLVLLYYDRPPKSNFPFDRNHDDLDSNIENETIYR